MADLSSHQPDQIALAVYEACARRVAAEPKRAYLGMSRIGDPCERRLWLDYHGADKAPLDGRAARIFDNGDHTETRVVADLQAAGYQITGQQDAFEDFQGRFRGHCDGLIHGVTQKPHLLEIKSANATSFKAFQKHGHRVKPVYAAQMQVYMGYANLERALFVVENKNTQELYTERVYFDRARFEELQDKARRILETAEAPDKIEDDTECRWCDFRDLGCLNPPTAAPAEPCRACAFWRSTDDLTTGTIEVIQTLRTIIEMLKPLSQLDQCRAEPRLKDALQLALAYRRDMLLPLELFHHRAADTVVKFERILTYILKEKNGWVDYANEADLLRGHYIPRPPAGPWCAHHQRRIARPIGCSDFAESEVPF